MPLLLFLARATLYGLGWVIAFGEPLLRGPIVIALLTGAGLVGGGIRFAAERNGPLLKREEMMMKVALTVVLGPFFLFFLGLLLSLGTGYNLASHLRYVGGGTLLFLAMTPALVPKRSADADAGITA